MRVGGPARLAAVSCVLAPLVLAALTAPAGAATDAARCAAGVTTNAAGTEIHGTPCADLIVVTSPTVRVVEGGEGDDTIYANPDVEEVIGGPGDDVIYGELLETETGLVDGPAPTSIPEPAYEPVVPSEPRATGSIEEVHCTALTNCFGGLGNQRLIGSAGNDLIFGERGNDQVEGNAGEDALYGGIGDEAKVVGGAGDDLVSGGPGADYVNGNEGSDLVRGDGTTDEIKDTGSNGIDTLSFATAVTPGFHGALPLEVEGFPADTDDEERGVFVRLDGVSACGGFQACDNSARYAGGNDEIETSETGAGFEDVIGSPFADVIVGSGAANVLAGGGGADVLIGGGGGDVLYGGAEGDLLEGGTGADTGYGQSGTNHCVEVEIAEQCSGEEARVVQRDRSKIDVGLMASPGLPEVAWSELYLLGGEAEDRVTATYDAAAETVSFAASAGTFDTSPASQTEGCTYTATLVECELPARLDAVLVSGGAGDDEISTYAGTFPTTTTPVLLGGEGDDLVKGGGNTEDVLVDGNGSGADELYAYNWDDWLLNNEGADALFGGNGNDLLVSATTCDGDLLDGAGPEEGDGAAKNDASWAQLPGPGGTVVDLEAGSSGSAYEAGAATCPAGSPDTLTEIDDLEGSSQADRVEGDAAPNLLLGHKGEDQLFGLDGEDTINSTDGAGAPEADLDNGGSGTDNCIYDSLDTLESCP